MKRFISISFVLIICLSLFTGCGGGLRGRYVSEATDMNYYEFKGGNKVTAGQLGVTMDGTYEVDGDIVYLTLVMEVFGAEVPTKYALKIKDDNTLVDTSLGFEVTYRKK